MKYKLITPVTYYDGKDIPTDDKENSPAMTYKDIVVRALNIDIPNTQYPPDQKAKAFFITKKAFEPDAEGMVEFTADDISLILERIKLFFMPVIVGRAEEFFNQKN